MGPQAFAASDGRVPGEVIEGVVDGTAGQAGFEQAVEVSQYLSAFRAEVVVQLATAAQLQDVQQDAPAGEEATGIGDGLLIAGVGQLVQPGVPQGEEMAQGPREDGPDLLVGCQVRPRRRRRCRTWVRINALLS